MRSNLPEIEESRLEHVFQILSNGRGFGSKRFHALVLDIIPAN